MLLVSIISSCDDFMVKIVTKQKNTKNTEKAIVLINSRGEITSSNLLFKLLFCTKNQSNISEIFNTKNIKSLNKVGNYKFELIDNSNLNIEVVITESLNKNLTNWEIFVCEGFIDIYNIEQKIEAYLLDDKQTTLIENSSAKTKLKIERNLKSICSILNASFIVLHSKNIESETEVIFTSKKLTDEITEETKQLNFKVNDSKISIANKIDKESLLSKASITKVISFADENAVEKSQIIIAYKNESAIKFLSNKNVDLIVNTLKRKINKYRQSEFYDFMRFGYNNAPNPVVWIDKEGEVIYCNKASKQFTGVEKIAFIGECLYTHYPEIEKEIKSNFKAKVENSEQGLLLTLKGGLLKLDTFNLKIKRLKFEKKEYYCIYGVNINSQVLSEQKLSHQKQYLIQLHKIHTSNYNNIENLLSDYLKSGCSSYNCNIGIINEYRNNKFKIIAKYGKLNSANVAYINNFSKRVLDKETTLVVHNPFDEGAISFILGSPIYLEDELAGVTILCSTKSTKQIEGTFDSEFIDLLSLNIANILFASKIDLKRRETDKKLKRSELRYKAIIDDQSELICRFDKNEVILFVNNAYCELVNKTQEQLIGSNLLREELEDEVKQSFKARLKKLTYEQPLTSEKEEVFFPNAGENGRWIAWNDRAIFDEHNNLIEYQTVGTDITNIKNRAVDQKRRLEYLQKIIDTIPNTIMVKDASGIILMCNSTAAKNYGLTVSELVGKNDYDLNSGFVKDDIFKKSDLETINKNDLMVFPDQEMTDPTTGRTRYFQSFKMPIRSITGKKDNILVVSIDITDRKLVSMALENSNSDLKVLTEKLKKSNEELQNFAYVASHDLQEPLRMIASYMQLLNRKYADNLDDTAKEFIYFAVDGAKRMQSLITDLLEYSRIQTRVKPFKQFNLNRLMKEVLQNLKQKIEENKAIIDCSELPEIVGDRSQISRLIQNLIDNAIKFKGEANPIVKITCNEFDTFYKFIVADNGIGISPEYKNKVFEIFNRLHSTAEYKGTGIGLSICKKVVQRHNGDIWIDESELGGSNFTFTIGKLTEAN